LILSAPTIISVTVRRSLGAGPAGIRAAEADLLGTLPGGRLPDLDALRDRGVFEAPAAVPRGERRILGMGGRPDDGPAAAPAD
jgi:hypothetical protein